MEELREQAHERMYTITQAYLIEVSDSLPYSEEADKQYTLYVMGKPMHTIEASSFEHAFNLLLTTEFGEANTYVDDNTILDYYYNALQNSYTLDMIPVYANISNEQILNYSDEEVALMILAWMMDECRQNDIVCIEEDTNDMVGDPV